jgi:hypothetical protein
MSSAEQMLGMSLDDIIKQDIKKKPAAKKDGKGKQAPTAAGGRGGRGGRGGAQAGRGGSSAGRGEGKPFGGQQRNSNLSVSRGGISKPRGSLSNRPIRSSEPIVRVGFKSRLDSGVSCWARTSLSLEISPSDN